MGTSVSIITRGLLCVVAHRACIFVKVNSSSSSLCMVGDYDPSNTLTVYRLLFPSRLVQGRGM